jgi:hypothetical protein
MSISPVREQRAEGTADAKDQRAVARAPRDSLTFEKPHIEEGLNRRELSEERVLA